MTTVTLINDLIVIRDIAEVDRAYPTTEKLVEVIDKAIELLTAAPAPPPVCAYCSAEIEDGGQA